MVARVSTVAFQGIETFDVDVQVQTSAGLPTFTIVGHPNKAVDESRERVRGAHHVWAWRCPTSASPSIWRPPIC